MDDYLTRVAEAVRDAVLDETVIVEMPALRTVCRDRIDLPAVIASVPRPEPVAWVATYTEDGTSRVIFAGDSDLAGLHEHPDCWGLKPLYADAVAAQPAVPVGYDPKEIDNVFSTLRYVIGLNPGKKAPTAHCQDIIERVASWSDMGKFHPMYSQFRAAAADRAMLAAAPEAPQVAVQDRRAEACLTAMDHISTETLESFNRVGIKFDATRGYAEELEAEIATLREQNAALVAALEGVLRWIDHWAQTGPGMDFERVEAAADAALACVKGGAV